MKRVLQLLVPRRLRKGEGESAPRFRPAREHPVEVQIMGSHSLDVLRARDISSTGIGVFVPHRFEGIDLANPVELVISLPKQRPFVTRGRIRHASERGGETPFYGVELTQLSNEHRSRLTAYLRSGLAEPVEREGLETGG